MANGSVSNPTPNGGANRSLDTSSITDTAGQAKELYNAVKQAALDFEFETAGDKLGRDKAKSVTG